jgi:hypothetical protein
MLTSVSTEDLIPADHPIRKIRVVVDAVLAELDDTFDEMYSAGGRRSVPPVEFPRFSGHPGAPWVPRSCGFGM